jgi:hypothetical protein
MVIITSASFSSNVLGLDPVTVPLIILVATQAFQETHTKSIMQSPEAKSGKPVWPDGDSTIYLALLENFANKKVNAT